MLHLLIEADWRSLARWGPLPTLIANDRWSRQSLPAWCVQRLLCQGCEAFFLTTDPAPAQACPYCGGALTVVGVWDLRRQARLPWYDPEDY